MEAIKITEINYFGIWFEYKNEEYHLHLKDKHANEKQKRAEIKFKIFLLGLVKKDEIDKLEEVKMGEFLDIG